MKITFRWEVYPRWYKIGFHWAGIFKGYDDGARIGTTIVVNLVCLYLVWTIEREEA